MKRKMYIGLFLSAKKDIYSSDLKIKDYQLMALTDVEAKKISKEFENQAISQSFTKYDVSDENSLRVLLRFTKEVAPENFSSALDMVMTHADSEIAEKLIALQQKGLLNRWLSDELDAEESSKMGTNEALSEVDVLDNLLSKLDDPELKNTVLSKFIARLQSVEKSK